MASIIRSSKDTERDQLETGDVVDEKSLKTSTHNSLTNSEIGRNLFIYNTAGHETTGSTMTYAIGLVCYQEWQKWLRVELRADLGEGEVTEDQY